MLGVSELLLFQVGQHCVRGSPVSVPSRAVLVLWVSPPYQNLFSMGWCSGHCSTTVQSQWRSGRLTQFSVGLKLGLKESFSVLVSILNGINAGSEGTIGSASVHSQLMGTAG